MTVLSEYPKIFFPLRSIVSSEVKNEWRFGVNLNLPPIQNVSIPPFSVTVRLIKTNNVFLKWYYLIEDLKNWFAFIVRKHLEKKHLEKS